MSAIGFYQCPLSIAQVQVKQLLVLEKNNLSKNFKYRRGEELMIRMREARRPIPITLGEMNDTSLVLGQNSRILFCDIEEIWRPSFLPGFMKELGIKAGLGTLIIPPFNNLIKRDNPIFEPLFLKITGGFFIMAVIADQFRYKKYRIPEHWKLKVLDYSKLNQ